MILLSSSIVIMGPAQTFTFLANLFSISDIDMSAFKVPFVDGTLRFLSVIFFVFAAIVLNVARDFRDNYKLIPILMLIMLIGGAARGWSIWSSGEGGSMISFAALLAEVLPPLLILILYFVARPKERI